MFTRVQNFIKKAVRVSVGVAVIAGLVLGAGSISISSAAAASAEATPPTSNHLRPIRASRPICP